MSDPILVGINGFGRIGRLTFRSLCEQHRDTVQVVAINDLVPPESLGYSLRHDSNYGAFPGCVEAGENELRVDGRDIAITAERDPADIPWHSFGVQVVVESTGFFRAGDDARKHFVNSPTVKKVLMSAPAKSDDVFTIVLGVNDSDYDPKMHDVISNASCTTNCLAPVAKVLHDSFGIERGILTTVHAYTSSQALVDAAMRDPSNARSGRAAGDNMVPGETGAAKAVELVLPKLKGKFTGIAVRVPTSTVSLIDFTALLSKDVTVAEVNGAIKAAAEGKLKGILAYTEEPLVSSDLRGDAHSSIFSACDTLVLAEPSNFVKALAWYDNEWGYASRLADLCAFVGKKGL